MKLVCVRSSTLLKFSSKSEVIQVKTSNSTDKTTVTYSPISSAGTDVGKRTRIFIM